VNENPSLAWLAKEAGHHETHSRRFTLIMAAVAALAAGAAITAAASAAPPATGASLAHPLTAYVANSNSGTVTAIRTATNRVVRAVKVGHVPFAIAITPDGKTAYVADNAAGMVTPIRTATDKALKPIKVGLNPVAIAITP
jgi:YVTN family beta-propeller protein